MQACRGRAIVASALPDRADGLRAELERLGFSPIRCVSDGMSALMEARSCPTELILADAVLPVLDAAGISQRLHRAPMNVYPALVVLGEPEMFPQSADCRVLTLPLSQEQLLGAMEALRPDRRPVPADRHALAGAMLDSLGVPQHPGREYLIRAAEIAWLDSRMLGRLTTALYPAVAQRFGVDKRQVERAMRHVIDVAWRGSEMEAQYKLFGDTIDARRGSPTLGEMIARIADILRWEGNA